MGCTDGDHLHLRFGEEIEDHQRIVDTNIDIEHNSMAIGHPVSSQTKRASRSPGRPASYSNLFEATW